MPKHSLVVEVDRLKNLVESLGWKMESEKYVGNMVIVLLLKTINDPKEAPKA